MRGERIPALTLLKSQKNGQPEGTSTRLAWPNKTGGGSAHPVASRSRLPLMAPMPGCIGARKLVSVSGWAKHAILYEFTSMEMVEQHFADHSDWSAQVVKTLVHAPHSPSLGTRVWPPAS